MQEKIKIITYNSSIIQKKQYNKDGEGKMKNRKIVLKEDLKKGFQDLGLEEGDNVIVHASLSSLGFEIGRASCRERV